MTQLTPSTSNSAPTIIVEDGTIVDNANSYADESFVLTYLASICKSLSATSEQVACFLVAGTEYLNFRWDDYVGYVEPSSNQRFAWPRSGACRRQAEIGNTEIPEELKNALALLVWHQSQGIKLFPDPVSKSATTPLSTFTSKKALGPLAIEYKALPVGASNADHDNIGPLGAIKIPEVEVLLQPIIGGSFSRVALRV